MRVMWHRHARQDLVALRAYIANTNPSAAGQVAQRIQQAVTQLVAHPGLGRLGRVPDIQELVIAGTPYIAAYRVVDEIIVNFAGAAWSTAMARAVVIASNFP